MVLQLDGPNNFPIWDGSANCESLVVCIIGGTKSFADLIQKAGHGPMSTCTTSLSRAHAERH
eukprot:scaffold269880_cov20-Prasinocladus_malaysianus.AAC.1